jgi:hypothetical protein
MEGSPQVHQSADVGPTTPVYRNVLQPLGETCWSDNAGSYAYQCTASYKTHVGTPNSFGGCGSYSGYLGSLSGRVYGPPAEYACEEWSYAGQVSLAQWPSASKVFFVLK